MTTDINSPASNFFCKREFSVGTFLTWCMIGEYPFISPKITYIYLASSKFDVIYKNVTDLHHDQKCGRKFEIESDWELMDQTHQAV